MHRDQMFYPVTEFLVIIRAYFESYQKQTFQMNPEGLNQAIWRYMLSLNDLSLDTHLSCFKALVLLRQQCKHHSCTHKDHLETVSRFHLPEKQGHQLVPGPWVAQPFKKKRAIFHLFMDEIISQIIFSPLLNEISLKHHLPSQPSLQPVLVEI